MAEMAEIYNHSALYLPALWQAVASAEPEAGITLTLLREGNTRRIHLAELLDGRKLIVKHWFRRGRLFRSQKSLNRHGVDRESRMTELAHDRGVGPFRPLALAHRGAGSRRQSLLVLPFLDGHVSLFDVLQSGDCDTDCVNSLVYTFGANLAQIHRADIRHDDYKLDNVLLDPSLPRTEGWKIIDWGKSWELDAADREARLTEVTSACKALLRKPASEREIRLFFDGYSDGSRWFAAQRDALVAGIEERIPGEMQRSLQRVWSNSLRKARRLHIGAAGDKRFFVFNDVPLSEVLACVAGEPSSFAADTRQPESVWRAANVLRVMGRDYGGVAGLVIVKEGLRRRRFCIVYRPGAEPFAPEELLRSAEGLLERGAVCIER